ncbi:MAG: D-aminoacyl-tRNA deacylase [Myxococcales bacterium]|jgi:D-tyrosyl-tRNA(Tyr) deacylase
MRAVVQRVSSASVTVSGETVSSIGTGLLVLLGVGKEDSDSDVDFLADKVVNLRIFEDEAGKMNRSVIDAGGELLVVSQFTLFGDARKGRRPSFTDAMEPVRANELYKRFCEACRRLGVKVGEGVFRADMKVALVNEGPVTLLLDSKRLF